MEVSFVFPGAGQMPLACRVPLAFRKVQIQLMGSYSVAYPDMVFRKSVSEGRVRDFYLVLDVFIWCYQADYNELLSYGLDLWYYIGDFPVASLLHHDELCCRENDFHHRCQY